MCLSHAHQPGQSPCLEPPDCLALAFPYGATVQRWRLSAWHWAHRDAAAWALPWPSSSSRETGPWQRGQEVQGHAESEQKPQPPPGTLGQSLQPVPGSGAGRCPSSLLTSTLTSHFSQEERVVISARRTAQTFATHEGHGWTCTWSVPAWPTRGLCSEAAWTGAPFRLAHQGQRGPLRPLPAAQ